MTRSVTGFTVSTVIVKFTARIELHKKKDSASRIIEYKFYTQDRYRQ